MTLEETRLSRKDSLNQKLVQKYEGVTFNDTQCFLLSNGMVFRIDTIGGNLDALVLEYADSIEMAKKNVFGEDGDLYYMSELDEDAMFNAMIREIENYEV